MKIRSMNFILFLLLIMFLFCAGCDQSSKKEKNSVFKTIPSSNRSKIETSILQVPDFRKKAPAAQKVENARKRTSQSGKRREKDPSNEHITKGKKNFSSPKETKRRTFSMDPPRKESSQDHRQRTSEEARETKSGTHSTDNRKRSVPAGWASTDIKRPPSPTNLEIWNSILVSLEKLIVARQVKFSSLGASHTSLTNLSREKYKAIGRCTVSEKTGNQIAYQFECIALVNKYETSILSVKFYSQDN